MRLLGAVRRRLEVANPVVLAAYGAFASFSAYFSMYAFRKPFGAAKYEGLYLFSTKIELKTAFVTGQLIGYILSKFIGIKVCSETGRNRRAKLLIGLIVAAELTLLLFAMLPPNWKVAAIFLNGLPLGMVWGLVVLYLEGRRTSEALLAGLSCSFILASGIVKDIGRDLMAGSDQLSIFAMDISESIGTASVRVPNPFASFGEVDQFWMPFATGLLFLVPFAIAVWLLEQMPQPTEADEAARVRREPMDSVHRWAFIRHFLPGMLMLLVAYFFMTAYRDYRDNFGVEIFAGLGYAEAPGIFSRSEAWVTLGVLLALAALVFVRNNRWGLVGAFAIMVTGTAMLGFGTLLLDAGRISGLTWMILTGLGVYLAYVPYGSVLFDRLIASSGIVGTAVFAIYVADFVGYVGPITVMQVKDLAFAETSRLDFFRGMSYFLSILATGLLVASCVYFLWGHRHGRHKNSLESQEVCGDENE